jgi:predicted RNA-binding Zn ribbon-like protein
VAHKRKAGREDLGVLNEYLSRGLSRVKVSEGEGSYQWDWNESVSPEMMLYPIASSAASLLTSEDLSRVRECANEEEGCGSLFLDCSKSQSRKWCSMESCGNRMKFRTYYDKHLRATHY